MYTYCEATGSESAYFKDDNQNGTYQKAYYTNKIRIKVEIKGENVAVPNL